MDTWNQIKSTLSRPETIDYISQLLLDEDECLSRPNWSIIFARSLSFKTRCGQNQIAALFGVPSNPKVPGSQLSAWTAALVCWC